MKSNRNILYDTPVNKCYILVIYLYCVSDANYEMCKEGRIGLEKIENQLFKNDNNSTEKEKWKNWTKWEWFDCLLILAIAFLSMYESANTYLYSGLKNVVFDKNLKEGRFFAHTSTSYDKSVAMKFIGKIIGVFSDKI